MNNIVRHSNEINNFKTGILNEAELDLFITSLYLLKDKKTDTITLPFAEFRKLAEIKGNHTGRFINHIESMSAKLLKMNQKVILPNGVIKMFNFFRTITIDPNIKIVTLAVNEDFQYLINDLVGNYTEYDLKHIVGLSSKYSKQLFKLLKQFDNNLSNQTKFCLKKKNELKEVLGVAEGYDSTSFSKLLKEITKELSPYFEKLKLHKLNKDLEPIKRGQKTEYLKWTWINSEGLMKVVDKYTKQAPAKTVIALNKKTNKEIETDRFIQEVEALKKKELDYNPKEILRKAIIKDFLETNKTITLDVINKLNSTLVTLNCDKVEYEESAEGYILKLE